MLIEYILKLCRNTQSDSGRCHFYNLPFFLCNAYNFNGMEFGVIYFKKETTMTHESQIAPDTLRIFFKSPKTEIWIF